MDTRKLEKQTFRSLRRNKESDNEKTLDSFKIDENSSKIDDKAIAEVEPVKDVDRAQNSLLGTNKTADELRAEIDERIKSEVNRKIMEWSEAHPGEFISSEVIVDIQSECVRAVNVAYKTVGGLESQIKNEEGLMRAFDDNNRERIDRYEGIKRTLVRQGYTEESIDLYVIAVNEDMKDLYDRVGALPPKDAARVDMIAEAERVGVKHRGVLVMVDNGEIKENTDSVNVIDDIISKSEKEAEEKFPAFVSKDVDPFANVSKSSTVQSVELPGAVMSENGVADKAFDIMESQYVEKIDNYENEEVVNSVIETHTSNDLSEKEDDNRTETPTIVETEAIEHLDKMMAFSKSKLLQVEPKQLRNMDPLVVRSMMNRRVGSTWRNYLPASNYYGVFVESKEIGKSSQMLELIGSEIQGYSKTEEILRLIYNSMEMEVNGYVSFDDFLKHTADSDLDLIYMNSAIVNAPRNGDGANPLIPITGVRCLECDRSLALVKNINVEDGKKEQYEVDIVQLLKKAYPKKLVAKRLVAGDIVSSNHTIKEANSKVEFGKSYTLELQDEISVYRFVFSIPSIKRSLSNAGKYRLYIQEATLNKIEKEIMDFADDDMKTMYGELLELGAEEFSDRMGTYATALQDKGTDRLTKRRISKVLVYNGEALDESKEVVEIMQYLTDVYIAPTKEYIDNYVMTYPEVTREEALDIFAIHKNIDNLTIEDAKEIIQSLIPASVYKQVKDKVNEMIEIDSSSSVDVIMTTDEIKDSIVKPDICTYDEKGIIEYCIDNDLDIDIISKAVKYLNEGKCQCGCDKFTITTQELLFFSTACQMRAESTKKFK